MRIFFWFHNPRFFSIFHNFKNNRVLLRFNGSIGFRLDNGEWFIGSHKVGDHFAASGGSMIDGGNNAKAMTSDVGDRGGGELIERGILNVEHLGNSMLRLLEYGGRNLYRFLYERGCGPRILGKRASMPTHRAYVL